MVVLADGAQLNSAALTNFLSQSFAKWWLPDAFEAINEIPRTSTGKFLKSALRERFAD